jgi:hypothetical protein
MMAPHPISPQALSDNITVIIVDVYNIVFQPKMDVIKVERDSDEESLCMPSHNEEEQFTDVKHEEQPVPEPFCIVKTEACVSFVLSLVAPLVTLRILYRWTSTQKFFIVICSCKAVTKI